MAGGVLLCVHGLTKPEESVSKICADELNDIRQGQCSNFNPAITSICERWKKCLISAFDTTLASSTFTKQKCTRLKTQANFAFLLYTLFSDKHLNELRPLHNDCQPFLINQEPCEYGGILSSTGAACQYYHEELWV